MPDFFQTLKTKISSLLINNRRVILVGGCFDIFHYGHLQFLKAAKATGDFLIIALESDEFIRKIKKREPVHSQGERQEILQNLKIVDFIIPLPFFTSFSEYSKLVNIVHPQIIAVTNSDPQILNKQTQAKEINAEVKIVISKINNLSSTQILKEF